MMLCGLKAHEPRLFSSVYKRSIFMKKLMLLLLTATVLACNTDNRSSERPGSAQEQTPVSPAEPDSTSIHNDTTTSGGMNRQNQYDTLH